jgi:Holliday junction DNA helicase RuvA
MIYSLNGKLTHTEPELAVIECGGVGYACKTTFNTLQKIAGKETVFLYTYMSVREDAMELFGFAEKEELKCFKLLISVSGVGPKVALSILSGMNTQQFALCVATSDSKALTKIKGIGTKIAQRIILELKDKLAKSLNASAEAVPAAAAVNLGSGNISKAMEALGVLGYTPADVSQVLAQFDPGLPVEQLIAMTLKQMGRK